MPVNSPPLFIEEIKIRALDTINKCANGITTTASLSFFYGRPKASKLRRIELPAEQGTDCVENCKAKSQVKIENEEVVVQNKSARDPAKSLSQGHKEDET